MTELEKKQKTIIDHYGIDKQLDMLVEECAELIQAIQKYKRYELSEYSAYNLSNLIEEMADVENIIEQIKLKDGTIGINIKINKHYKADRQLERISLEENGRE